MPIKDLIMIKLQIVKKIFSKKVNCIMKKLFQITVMLMIWNDHSYKTTHSENFTLWILITLRYLMNQTTSVFKWYVIIYCGTRFINSTEFKMKNKTFHQFIHP